MIVAVNGSESVKFTNYVNSSSLIKDSGHLLRMPNLPKLTSYDTYFRTYGHLTENIKSHT